MTDGLTPSANKEGRVNRDHTALPLTNGLYWLVVVIALLAAIACWPGSARAADPPAPPFSHIVGSFEAKLDVDRDLQQENERLKLKVRRLKRANHFHARWVQRLRAANRERLSFGAAGVVRGFLCIHRFEGSWNDSGAPYFGGLQMDLGFMRSYGRSFLKAWGTADHWPPFVQVAVALIAKLSGRGFYPWPNTARSCGLL